jgi:hypothetical protein
LDCICILNEYEQYWSECFKIITRIYGPNTYSYGSLWNQEPQRTDELLGQKITGTPKKKFHIDIVNTRTWPTFDAYFRALSKTIRHDYQRAQRLSDMRVEVRRGFRAISLIPALIKCKKAVSDKHGSNYDEGKNTIIDFIEILGKIILFRNQAVIALAMYDANCLAGFFGIEFGNRLYYLTGGTIPNRQGAGSFLTLSLIKYLYENTPNGQFVMGFAATELDPSNYPEEGAFLYRRKLRVEAVSGVYESFSVPVSISS